MPSLHVLDKSGKKVKEIKAPDEILSLVAMRVPHDVRVMVGALRKIVAFANLVGQAISYEMASEILSHLGAVEAA